MLVIYLMAGPDTPALAEAAVAGGADIVEIGFPFSDPVADGPVIQAAFNRALEAGIRVAQVFEMIARIRGRFPHPLLAMVSASRAKISGEIATQLAAPIHLGRVIRTRYLPITFTSSSLLAGTRMGEGGLVSID